MNVLTDTPKISPETRGDIFQIKFPHNDKKHDKSFSSNFSKHLERFHKLTAKALSETVLLREFSNKAFHSL